MIDDPSLAHLLGRVGAIEDRIRRLVAARRAVDPQPDDPFRGLYLSDETVDRLLGRRSAASRTGRMPRPASPRRSRPPTWPRPRGMPLRLRASPHRSGSSQIDVDLLLIALAADLDPRFEQFFGYLNDDVSRRRPSVAVALELCGVPLTSAADRARLISGPLVTGGLVIVEDEDRPLPGRAVRVPDRVVGHLLGDDTPDRALEGVLREPSTVEWGDPSRVAQALAAGIRLVYLREPATGSGGAVAVRGIRLAWPGRRAARPRPARRASPTRSRSPGSPTREARLRGVGLIAAPVDRRHRRRRSSRRSPTRRSRPCSSATRRGTRRGSGSCPAMSVVEPTTRPGAPQLWRTLARARGRRARRAQRRPPSSGCGRSRCARGGHRSRAGDAARRPGVITAEHLAAGARAENASGARPAGPPGRRRSVGWDDLVLPRGPVDRAARGRAARPAPRAGARRLGDAARRRPRARRRRALRGRLGHRQDDVGRGGRRRARAWTSTSSTSRPSSTSTSARPRRTWSASSRPRPARTPCSSSTRPTPSSASAARCRTPTTATPTSRAPTCCSAWRPSTGSRSSRRTCARTSTRRSRAGSTSSSTSRCRMPRTARGSGTAASAPTVRRAADIDLDFLGDGRSSSPAAPSARPPSPPPTSPPPTRRRCCMRHCVDRRAARVPQARPARRRERVRRVLAARWSGAMTSAARSGSESLPERADPRSTVPPTRGGMETGRSLEVRHART